MKPPTSMRNCIPLWITAASLAAVIGLAANAGAQGALSALQTDVDEIVRRARPSVVTVFAARTEDAPRSGTAASAGTPQVKTRAGSGVAIEPDLILTTASVVLQAERILIGTANGLDGEAVIVGVDPVFNLALLRVPNLRLPPLKFARGRPARVGDWIVSLGTSYSAQPTQSLGNVAQRHREPGRWLLQLTNTVYPGNSGAAALHMCDGVTANNSAVMNRPATTAPTPPMTSPAIVTPPIPNSTRATICVAGAPSAASGRAWHVGDKVCALVSGGGYAERCVAPGVQCLPIPAGMEESQPAQTGTRPRPQPKPLRKRWSWQSQWPKPPCCPPLALRPRQCHCARARPGSR